MMSKIKALFIGNSYTYGNNLPVMVRELACAGGKDLETVMVASGGKSLAWHEVNRETVAAIDGGGWDFVILQDHSLQAIDEPEKLCRSVGRFAARIRKRSAIPVLFATWARKHLPEMQETIDAVYGRAAREHNARLAPVGAAWQRALAASPGLVLHQEDWSHPNWLGSYLAACVIVATLFGESPLGLPAATRLSEGVMAVVDQDIAAFLRKTAWASVQG
jgi:hypothetical protein